LVGWAGWLAGLVVKLLNPKIACSTRKSPMAHLFFQLHVRPARPGTRLQPPHDGDSAGIPNALTKGFRRIPGGSNGFRKKYKLGTRCRTRSFVDFHVSKKRILPFELRII
jgi:hypothetical protein